MKRSTVIVVGALLAMSLTWAAFGQTKGQGGTRRGTGGGRGSFGMSGEAQQKALADLQEQIGKLKAMSEQTRQGAQGRNFQNMSEEERTKMMEEYRKRAAEQQTILTAIQADVDRLKGGRGLMAEHEANMAPLKEALAAAQRENAKTTAQILEKLIAERQKQFEEKVTAMGYTMENLQRMGQRRQQQQ